VEPAIALKRLVLGALLAVAPVAHADQMQFKIQGDGGTTYASFANIRLLDAQNKQQFAGDTDRYGRINANVAPGNYRAIVNMYGKTKAVHVRLTGANNLQVITLN
jgi:hypothetical protein